MKHCPWFIWFLFSTAISAFGLDPSKQLTQYAHTAWRVQDGFLPTQALHFAQTADGFLWIGTDAGLERFDGIRFTPVATVVAKQLLSPTIMSLLTARDGSLWIGTTAGLSHMLGPETIQNIALSGIIQSIVEAGDGSIWIAREAMPTEDGPLCRVKRSVVRCYGAGDGIPFRNANSLISDGNDGFWLGGATMLIHWRAGSQTATFAPSEWKSNVGQGGVVGLAQAPDGTLWVGFGRSGRGMGLETLSGGVIKPFKTPQLDGSKLAVTSLLLDRENSLWVATASDGIYRIRGTKVDHCDKSDGLSSNTVISLYEDAEGSVWAATSNGVDKFSDLRVVTFSSREGFASDSSESVLASRDGTLWVGMDGALGSIHNGKISSIRPGDGLPGYQVASMFEDHAGRIWVGVDDGLYLYSHGHFQRIGGTTNQHLGLVVGITEDRENNIWVEASGAKRRLVRIQNFEVKEELSAAEVPEAHALAADPKGGIWLGLLDGDLALYRHGVVHRVRLNHPKDGITGEIVVNPDGSVLSATPYALVGWRNGTTQFLTSQNGLPCDGVYGFIRDKKNNLWLYTPCGLSEIDSAEFDRWWSHPDTKVQLRFFDTFDGVRPGRTYFWPVAKTPDGRLWFATGSSLQMIDPASLSKNAPPVPVNIESIVANRISYKPQEALRLPSLIRNLEVNYTALSFVAPRKLRFRYKLDGDDVSWQDPGTRRQAFYTDLRPGNYSFHVIATNSDGAWNDVGATLNFSIAPTWYQTVWFYVLCSLVILSLVLIVYSFRVQQLSTRMAAGFDERLAERTRLARELHDTLLQTIQGSKIIADDALDSATPSNPMRKPMEVLSGLLAVAVKEGRAALNSLRTFSAQGDDLADALKRATAPLIDTVPIQMHFSVRGETRDIHPIVRDEVYHIGYEAIRNASLHSSGSQLEVTIDYNDDLLLRVIDNGKGIDPIVLKEGRPGHFGLQGMTERADRIGGSISFFSSEASGTEVRLTVPGRSAFRKPHVLP